MYTEDLAADAHPDPVERMLEGLKILCNPLWRFPRLELSDAQVTAAMLDGLIEAQLDNMSRFGQVYVRGGSSGCPELTRWRLPDDWRTPLSVQRIQGVGGRHG